MGEILNEITQITAAKISKKQDDAKLNFPNIIKKIRKYAELGESECLIPITEMNVYDKNLLEAEGFSVFLIDRPKDIYSQYNSLAQNIPKPDKIWRIKW